ncbi:UTP--glucose-1-phosphate uridylyltransferase [Myxococcota bacterium]|nr:UTP--glucose-1-phosphate uridylyltransferase [Myxococcota bacterium]
MPSFSQRFEPFAKRLRDDQAHPLLIKNFQAAYAQLCEGETGLLPESQIQPPPPQPDAEELPRSTQKRGEKALPHTIQIRLNGGLGTSMGLQQAKSLLFVKQDLCFLDIIAQQSEALHIPLLLMNSFATQQDSLQRLQQHPKLRQIRPHLPLDFLQHRIPKIRQDNLSPVQHTEEELTWCPPGHGDIYLALITSGLLEALLQADIHYAFVANADNLGASVDLSILGYFAEHDFPFLMEVADRTRVDRKGGHLARHLDGHLLLRESAQCPPQDEQSFQDIQRYRYFNTNNIWLNLRHLQKTLEDNSGILGLPLIRNAKTVDPRDPASTPVFQLETAMGTAISIFSNAQALRVPRSRFAPVKTTQDLLAVRSDAYTLDPFGRIALHPKREGIPPVVSLDNRYYRLVDDLDQRFPQGPPSLLHCTLLSVQGDITFGRSVTCRGKVELSAPNQPQTLPDDAQLSGSFDLPSSRSIPTQPHASPHRYQAYYCEENIWQLAHESAFSDVEGYAVFISNPEKSCALWHQRASHSAWEPVLWDYHVLYLAATGPQSSPWEIWDLDTLLGMPVPLADYLSQTFCMTAELHPRYAPSFRLLPREIFLRDFYSDRSHMLDKHQTWRQPPPPWPPIMPNVPQPRPLLRIVAMQDPTLGPILDLGQLYERFLPTLRALSLPIEAPQ